MDPNRRRTLIYGFLLLAWVLVVGWQTAEHFRVQRAARSALIGRAKDISTTLGIVLRSQRRFGGVISRERLESALTDLVRPGDLNGIALLNTAGDVVASAGSVDESETKADEGQSEHWNAQTVTVMNLVDLGTNVTHDIEPANPPIVLRREEFFHSAETNRAGERLPPWWERDNVSSNNAAATTNAALDSAAGLSNPPPRHGGPGRPRFARPPWMGEEEYKTLLQKQGVHSFLIVMSTQAVRNASRQDLWLRFVIGTLATLAVVGTGFGWRNFSKSSDLQLRLVRASELNSHLREMNVAAAGLAHETRNPLNIVRGLAQMIFKEPGASEEIKGKSRQITDEVDRVTAQLNEFINYSRPREVRRAPVALGAVIHDVVRALQGDLAEKAIQLKIDDENLVVEADEQLLRQVLFNLVINSVQAVGAGGLIEILSRKTLDAEGEIEIRDNGPGVAVEHRSEIFKPYFTTRPQGTGLGLAIVSQIVLAHGWEIKYIPNGSTGAVFVLYRLKLANKEGVKT